MGEVHAEAKKAATASRFWMGLVVVGAAGAALVGLARVRSAALTPSIFALFLFLAAVIIVGSRGARRSRTTVTIVLVGVAAVLLIPILNSLGVTMMKTDLVAVVGAAAALVTLALVQRQIEIAQEQVGVALREIDLVEKDLAYSKEQSAFTRAQVAELTRRPRLSLAFTTGTQRIELSRVRGHHMFSADLLVRNSGDRTARDAYVEVLIPWGVLQHNLSDEQVLRQMDTELVVGVAHRRFGKQVADPVYRDLARSVNVFSHALVADPPSFTLRWRLRDDYGAYPEDADWGRLEVRAPLETSNAKLRYMPRWQGELHPMLGWDRSGADLFAYVSLAAEPSDEVAIIDGTLQERISGLVWSMPGLGGTTPVTGEVGVEFTLGDPRGPLSGADTAQIMEAQAYERSRHRCYVRADGGVEVRLPQDGGHPVQHVLCVLAAAYAIATVLHGELATEPVAHGRLVYKFGDLTYGLIGAETDRWIEMHLNRDDFVEYVTGLVMVLQRTGKTPPVESGTRRAVEEFWKPYQLIVAAAL